MSNWYFKKVQQLDSKIDRLKLRRDEVTGEAKAILVGEIQHLISERENYKEAGRQQC